MMFKHIFLRRLNLDHSIRDRPSDILSWVAGRIPETWGFVFLWKRNNLLDKVDVEPTQSTKKSTEEPRNQQIFNQLARQSGFHLPPGWVVYETSRESCLMGRKGGSRDIWLDRSCHAGSTFGGPPGALGISGIFWMIGFDSRLYEGKPLVNKPLAIGDYWYPPRNYQQKHLKIGVSRRVTWWNLSKEV